jgi:ubiquinone/menaquinone biosynthesis C-methylase UbiE/predicted transcriptional regulator YdeE
LASDKNIPIHNSYPTMTYLKGCYEIFHASTLEINSQIKEIMRLGIIKDTALEIGPGSGCLGLEWLKNTVNSNLIGLEISNEMAQIAKINAAKYGFLNGRAKYLSCITKTLPFEDNTFEAVFSNLALYEWDDPEVLFNEIYRVLKPGGRYYLSFLRQDMKRIWKWYLKLTRPEIKSSLLNHQNTVNNGKSIQEILFSTKLGGSKISFTRLRTRITGMKPIITVLHEPLLIMGVQSCISESKFLIERLKLFQGYQNENISNSISNKKIPPVFLTLTRDYDPALHTRIYIMAEAVTSLKDIPQGMTGYEIPASSYLVFPVRLQTQRDWPRALREMEQYIQNDWLPKSQYQKDSIIEEFDLWSGPEKLQMNPEIDIYVAIK